ncbi:hypothetical protein AAFC00_001937 [Neodothiora populina]|uniref:Uncharacterized protein n=1 Tax=Neodothiora populina TaxID=2781224 RepID=A0ABR3PQM9_9PEZI
MMHSLEATRPAVCRQVSLSAPKPLLATKKDLNGRVRALLKAGNLRDAPHKAKAPTAVPATPPPIPPLNMYL